MFTDYERECGLRCLNSAEPYSKKCLLQLLPRRRNSFGAGSSEEFSPPSLPRAFCSRKGNVESKAGCNGLNPHQCHEEAEVQKVLCLAEGLLRCTVSEGDAAESVAQHGNISLISSW